VAAAAVRILNGPVRYAPSPVRTETSNDVCAPLALPGVCPPCSRLGPILSLLRRRHARRFPEARPSRRPSCSTQPCCPSSLRSVGADARGGRLRRKLNDNRRRGGLGGRLGQRRKHESRRWREGGRFGRRMPSPRHRVWWAPTRLALRAAVSGEARTHRLIAPSCRREVPRRRRSRRERPGSARAAAGRLRRNAE
jgi:hypothetical protein